MLNQSLLNDIKTFLLSRFPETDSLIVCEDTLPYENEQVGINIHASEIKFSTDLVNLEELPQVMEDSDEDSADFIVKAFQPLDDEPTATEDKKDTEPTIRYSLRQPFDFPKNEVVTPKKKPAKGGLFSMMKAIPDIFDNLDEGFSVTLTKYIDKSGMTDADCYKKAQINKSHFNKIKNDPNYNVQKDTVFALILALSLDKKDADVLLSRAGYAFSSSSKFDTLIEYCINHKIYDLMEVNEILYTFDQKLLGAGMKD